MKKLFTLFFLALASLTLVAQTKLSPEFTEINRLKNKGIHQYNQYATSFSKGISYIHTVALIDHRFNKKQLASQGIIVGSVIKNIATLRIPVSLMNEEIALTGVLYLSPSHKVAPMLNKALKDTRVDSVHLGLTLPQPFSGKDVLIGITDWGFDYTSPMYYDTTLSHTRIFKAWDQFRNAGPAPQGFTYGSEFTGESALLAAQCDTFNIYQWATHGSHVAGICGGSGAGTPYRGVAYDANYLLATFLVDESSVIDAFNWMKTTAEQEGKRLVVNMSWGLYWMGNLDGTSLISKAIDAMSAEGVVFVSSAGNDGDETFHIKKEFLSNEDTLKTIIGFNNYGYYPTMWGQSVTAWGEPNHSFRYQLNILNTSNEIISSTDMFSTNQSGYIDTVMIMGTDTIFYNIMSDSSNYLNQRPHVRIRVKNKSSLYQIALNSVSDSGTVHYWNLIELTNDVGNWGGPFAAPIAGYTAGDGFYSIGEPACTESVISIAAHNAEIILPNGNVYLGGRAAFSSIGPTLDGRTKPDISAPGVSVASSLSSFTNATVEASSVISTVDFNGRTYKFVRYSGTSMSSPMVTGIVALMLQANPILTPQQIKEIIHQTARLDNNTGAIGDTGSVYWGWEKINALKAIKRSLELVNINEYNQDNLCTLYPIPASDRVYCLFNDQFKPTMVEIYNLTGQIIRTQPMTDEGVIDVSSLHGVFILKFIGNQTILNKKIIIQ